MHHLLRFALLVAAFALMPAIVPGIKVKSAGTAVLAALVFTVVNFFLGWIFKVVLVVSTLGLALLALNFLTNAVILWITDKLMDDVEVKTIGAGLLGALVITVANAIGVYAFR